MKAWVPAALLLGMAPAWGQSDELATGRFLVASRTLGDPNFSQTVILLVHYSEDDGTVGLILNRQTDLPLSRVFRDIKTAKGRTDLAFMGGPVEPGGVLALLKSPGKPEEATRVFGDVFLISSRELLEKTLANGVESNAFRVYLGYAGWGVGQLEHEMQLGAWHVLPPETGVVFDPDPDAVWTRMIRKTELRIARAGYSPHEPVQRDFSVVDH